MTHFWIIFLNIFGWLVIQLGISFACTKIPLGYFNEKNWFFSMRSWEKSGKIYLNFFRIKRWKHLLPDGASLYGKAFPKKKLENKDSLYLSAFLNETCRAELTHWLQIPPALIFFLWNIWWAGVIMIVYALAVNMPCILLQRYNRLRLSRVLKQS